MSTQAAAAATSSKATKSKKAASPKKAAAKPTHPPFLEMIVQAITESDETRKGASKQAIFKHLNTAHGIDTKVSGHHIRLALKRGVESGSIKQASGIGANGRFKVGDNKPEAAAKKPKSPRKPRTAKSTTPKPKKAAAPKAKKAAVAKKSPAKAPKKTAKEQIKEKRTQGRTIKEEQKSPARVPSLSKKASSKKSPARSQTNIIS